MNFRHGARAVLDRAAALTGVLGAYERAMRCGLTVLTYHRILPDQRCRGYHLPSLAMPLSAFREQVGYLGAHFRVVTISQGIKLLTRDIGNGPLLSLTFDDGYVDNHSIAAPILEEHGLHGTFYVTTGLVGTDRRHWFDQAAFELAGSGLAAGQ